MKAPNACRFLCLYKWWNVTEKALHIIDMQGFLFSFGPLCFGPLERKTGFEPATLSLGS